MQICSLSSTGINPPSLLLPSCFFLLPHNPPPTFWSVATIYGCAINQWLSSLVFDFPSVIQQSTTPVSQRSSLFSRRSRGSFSSPSRQRFHATALICGQAGSTDSAWFLPKPVSTSRFCWRPTLPWQVRLSPQVATHAFLISRLPCLASFRWTFFLFKPVDSTAVAVSFPPFHSDFCLPQPRIPSNRLSRLGFCFT